MNFPNYDKFDSPVRLKIEDMLARCNEMCVQLELEDLGKLGETIHEWAIALDGVEADGDGSGEV